MHCMAWVPESQNSNRPGLMTNQKFNDICFMSSMSTLPLTQMASKNLNIEITTSQRN